MASSSATSTPRTGSPAPPARPVTPDRVMTIPILAGKLGLFREMSPEGRARIKCHDGSLTLVSPGRSHESHRQKLSLLIAAISDVLEIPVQPLGSEFFHLPKYAEDVGYEPDEGYYIRSLGKATEGQAPDLALEVVVSHPADKAIRCGAALGIGEMWVLDVAHRKLTFYTLATRGKQKGIYQPKMKSRAFPALTPDDVLGRLDEPLDDLVVYLKRCRAWVEDVLDPRVRTQNGGGIA